MKWVSILQREKGNDRRDSDRIVYMATSFFAKASLRANAACRCQVDKSILIT